jgi:hypothetical protein
MDLCHEVRREWEHLKGHESRAGGRGVRGDRGAVPKNPKRSDARRRDRESEGQTTSEEVHARTKSS